MLIIGAVVLGILILGTGVVAERAADEEARSEARSINQVLANSLPQPAVRGLLDRNSAALDRIDRTVTRRLIAGTDIVTGSGGLSRVNIWSEQGVLLYSDRIDLIGETRPLDADERAVLSSGGSRDVLLPDDAPDTVNPTDAPGGTVRIYTGFVAPDGSPMLFESFYSLDNLEQRREDIYQPFRNITVAALVVLLLAIVPIIRVLTRQVAAAGEERERLLQSGLDISDAERRRIARDLHDGVVQELAGTAFSLAALGRDPATPEPTRAAIMETNRSLRDALKSLRSLMIEIPPPEATAEGLPAALENLVAPAARLGVEAVVEVEGVDDISDEQASLVLRVAQEAIRNALRHAEASHLDVRVSRPEEALRLQVIDDGHGFDTAAPRPRDRYGLTGMSTLVADRGGHLLVDSEVGAGTSVTLEVGVDG